VCVPNLVMKNAHSVLTIIPAPDPYVFLRYFFISCKGFMKSDLTYVKF
jgi:hypothetical protein